MFTQWFTAPPSAAPLESPGSPRELNHRSVKWRILYGSSIPVNCQITRLIILYIIYIIYDHHPSSWKGKSEKYGTMIQNQQLETEMGGFALPRFASWLRLLNRTWPSLFSDCHYQLTSPQGLLRVWAQYPRPTRSVEISIASIWAKVVQCGAFTPVQQLNQPSQVQQVKCHSTSIAHVPSHDINKSQLLRFQSKKRQWAMMIRE